MWATLKLYSPVYSSSNNTDFAVSRAGWANMSFLTLRARMDTELMRMLGGLTSIDVTIWTRQAHANKDIG